MKLYATKTNRNINFTLFPSVFFTLLVYYIFQSIIMQTFFTISHTMHLFVRFHVFSLSVHVLACILFIVLYIGLINRNRCTRLTYINIPLAITFVRISTLPTILFTFLIATNNEKFIIPLFVLVTVVSVSDAMDGFLSRKLNQRTTIGAYFDSMGDYAYLITVTILLLVKGYISTLLAYAVLFRLFFQLALTLLTYILHQSAPKGATPIGKITIGSLIVLFNWIILGLIPVISSISFSIAAVLEWITLIFVLVSTAERVYLFIKDMYAPPYEIVSSTTARTNTPAHNMKVHTHSSPHISILSSRSPSTDK